MIVTSAEEAREAVRGGADRLELVRDLAAGGLTPTPDVVRAVKKSVRVPVRVMLRENAGMSLGEGDEIEILSASAAAFAALPVDGLVLGFHRDGVVDTATLEKILDAAPHIPVTFHRAFESLLSPEDGIQTLRKFPQIDRILVRLAARFPLAKLAALQARAAPEVQFIAGLGLAKDLLNDLKHEPVLTEVHVGRAVREPETTSGQLDAAKVAALKSALS